MLKEHAGIFLGLDLWSRMQALVAELVSEVIRLGRHLRPPSRNPGMNLTPDSVREVASLLQGHDLARDDLATIHSILYRARFMFSGVSTDNVADLMLFLKAARLVLKFPSHTGYIVGTRSLALQPLDCVADPARRGPRLAKIGNRATNGPCRTDLECRQLLKVRS